MTSSAAVLVLQDLDQLLALARDPEAVARMKRMGFRFDGADGLLAERARLERDVERRWWLAYERSHARYGRGLTAVQGKVCQGCFVTLPISAAPPAGEVALHQCQSCGRLLFWR
ncbi:MAG: hypothetical protein HZA61_05445 [Candidatus Eisenbacteria bacterium]|uniref:C4-type zinc ribbon domain-containing protein n=1 Tax=Eiseniibacteriota bacterium TaxID=2212470 RepID=A0A933SEE8_UNCEI|nr:hypothetical protein [Candidatus Eisenbacteria bacterium]